MTYRVGRHNPRNIYRGDEHVGVMFDPTDGPMVVAALNYADIPEPDRPPHPTCIETTRIQQMPRREWKCGARCPRAGEHTEGHQ